MIKPYETTTAARDLELEAFFKLLHEGDLDAVRGAVEKDRTLVTAYAPNQWCCREVPLGVALQRGNMALTELLLDMGADPNQKSGWWAGGFAPLHVVAKGREDLVDLLLRRGAVVDAQAAASLGRIDDLTQLLDHDPFLVNMPGGDGGRPLHFAADPPVAKLLLDRGALLDPLDVDHCSTPAQWAVRDRQDVCRTLVDHGARTDVFMLAALGELERLQKWLEQHPADATRTLTREDFPSPGSKGGHMYGYALTGFGSNVLHVAAKFGSVPVIDALVSKGGDVAVRGGYDEQTPLHSAASSGNGDAIRRLVELGADIDAESGPEHRTPPLVWAIVAGSVQGVRSLVDVGAIVTPAVLETAEAGANGQFAQFSGAGPEEWSEIRGALATA